MGDLSISFDGEAGETFANIVLNYMQHFIVQVTPQEGEKYDMPFDAVIVGTGDGWYDAVKVRAYNEDTGEPEGEPFQIRVKDILVY